MFGLIERSRLAMYDATLSQAKSDAGEIALFHTAALMSGLHALMEVFAYVSGGSYSIELHPTLGQIIKEIPSEYLSDIDGVLVSNVPAPRMDQQYMYQMQTLLNGLVFVRIIQVAKPKLLARAQAFQGGALSFMEPLYQRGVAMMNASVGD